MGGVLYKIVVMGATARVMYRIEKQMYELSEDMLNEIMEATGVTSAKAIEYALRSREDFGKFIPEL